MTSASRTDAWASASWTRTIECPGGLTLQPLAESHAQALAHQYRDAQTALRTGLPAMRAGGARDWIAQRQSESPATYAWMHVELGLVGYGELHLEGSTASLCLWIGCDFRGRGFGTRLVKALCSLARANGLQRVLSAAFSDNLHSLRALRAAGFVEFEAEGFDRTCRHLVWTPHSLTPHEAQQHLVEFCRRRDRRRLHG